MKKKRNAFSTSFMDFPPLCLSDEVMVTLTRGSLSSVSHTGSLVTVVLCPNTGGWSTGRERAEGHSGSALERTE